MECGVERERGREREREKQELVMEWGRVMGVVVVQGTTLQSNGC